jgi:hypothetical protein
VASWGCRGGWWVSIGLYVLRVMTDGGLCGPSAYGDEEVNQSERCRMIGR